MDPKPMTRGWFIELGLIFMGILVGAGLGSMITYEMFPRYQYVPNIEVQEPCDYEPSKVYICPKVENSNKLSCFLLEPGEWYNKGDLHVYHK